MATTRSPNYPAISLPEAVELVKKLFQREQRSPVGPEEAALALGYNSVSGASRTKLSGLRKFGLVEDTATGIRVSDLAMAILHPDGDEEKRAALRKAATTPGLFRELSELPGASDENLVSRLVRQGFTESGARLAVASYRKTTSLAPGDSDEYPDVNDESEPMLAALDGSAGAGRKLTPASTNRGGTVLYIGLPGGSAAELRLPPEVTPDGLKAVVEWLGTAPKAPEASASTDESLTPEPDPSEPLLLSGRSPDDAPD